MSIVDNIKAEVTSIMQQELEHTYHTAGLMLKQVSSKKENASSIQQTTILFISFDVESLIPVV